MRRLLAVTAATLCAGCATTLSTLQTARPVDKGHLSMQMGYGIYAPLGPAGIIISQAAKQAQVAKQAIETGQQYQLSQDDQQSLITAGIATAVMPPSATYEYSARLGIADDLDVGARYSINAIRADAKLRLAHAGDDIPSPSKHRIVPRARWYWPLGTEDDENQPEYRPGLKSWDFAIGIGVSRYLFSNIVFDILDYAQAGNFSRWDVELPLYFSFEIGDIFAVYVAPKYVYSHTDMDEKFIDYMQQAANASGLDTSIPAHVDTHFVGSTVGISAGYRYVHVLLEMTGGYTYAKPKVFGQTRDLGGVTLYPAGAIQFKF